MSLLLNILWIVFGGAQLALGWWLAALLMAISIVGLPWAAAAFRIGLYCLWPFDTEQAGRLSVTGRPDLGTGGIGALGNIIWFLLAGWWLAIGHVLAAIAQAITIIGIPFAYAHLKLAGAALFPIGKVVRRKGDSVSPFA